MADKAPLLTPAQVSELVLQLRADRVRKLEFVAALTEGVILGVEQVQEIRISNLEAGPEITIGNLVADAFWGFLFDSSINILFSKLVLDRFLGQVESLTAGMAVIQARRSEILKADALSRLEKDTVSRARHAAHRDLEILRANFSSYGRRKGEQTSVNRLSPELKQFMSRFESADVVTTSADLLKNATEEVVRIFHGKAVGQRQRDVANALALVASEARDFRIMLANETDAQNAAGVLVEQLLGATRSYLSDSGAKLTGVPATDLLASAYAWASRQRQQITLLYDGAESMLVQAANIEDVGELGILLGATCGTLNVDIGDIRARSWKLSEAVIWAESFRAHLLGAADTGAGDNELTFINIPGRIAGYLIERFADDAWRWVRSSNADSALVLPRGGAMESRTTAQVRARAMDTLRRAREVAKLRVAAPAEKTFLRSLLDPEATAAQYDAIAVRAFLLAMLYLYRRSAQDLASLLEKTREDLRAD
jgi:hypothetical protein